MPFGILCESMKTNKLIFFVYRRAMFGPRTFAVRNDLSFLDKLYSEGEGTFVELNAAPRLSGNGADRNKINSDCDRMNKGNVSNDSFHYRVSRYFSAVGQ